MFTIKEYDPVVSHSGFYMEGYYVWCGSLIKGPDGLYYLFAARWPEETTFPIGYMTHSEIVLATTSSLDQPFEFQKVVMGPREGDYWDSVMSSASILAWKIPWMEETGRLQSMGSQRIGHN